MSPSLFFARIIIPTAIYCTEQRVDVVLQKVCIVISFHPIVITNEVEYAHQQVSSVSHPNIYYRCDILFSILNIGTVDKHRAIWR